jgi:hypothetical protein
MLDRRSIAAVFLCALLAAAGPARRSWAQSQPPALVYMVDDEADRICVGAGADDILNEGYGRTPGQRATGLVEYRNGHKLFFAGPLLGALADADGGVFGYGGLFFDVAVGSWRLSPMLTAGGYRRGDSKDLGGVFQFQLGGSLSYEFESGLRIGVDATHISNRNLHYVNPGEETLFVTLAFPLS